VQSWAFGSLYHAEKDSWALKSYLTVAQLQLFCFKRPEIPVSKLQKAIVYEALLSRLLHAFVVRRILTQQIDSAVNFRNKRQSIFSPSTVLYVDYFTHTYISLFSSFEKKLMLLLLSTSVFVKMYMQVRGTSL
jgi:hypothetical protein